MLGRCGHAAFDRIIVQIVEFLVHHPISHDRLRMRSFLPDLMCARLMRGPVILQLVKQPMTSFRFQLNDDLTSSKALQITQNGRECGSRKDRVQVIVQDHPAINFETLMLSTMLE